MRAMHKWIAYIAAFVLYLEAACGLVVLPASAEGAVTDAIQLDIALPSDAIPVPATDKLPAAARIVEGESATWHFSVASTAEYFMELSW